MPYLGILHGCMELLGKPCKVMRRELVLCLRSRAGKPDWSYNPCIHGTKQHHATAFCKYSQCTTRGDWSINRRLGQLGFILAAYAGMDIQFT